MKKQIKRLSPHQNGKVFGVLLAVCILPIFLPMLAVMQFAAPPLDASGNPVEFPFFVFYVFPFIYLALGYVGVVIGCAVYNFIQKYTGGFEFEVSENS